MLKSLGEALMLRLDESLSTGRMPDLLQEGGAIPLPPSSAKGGGMGTGLT